MRAFVPPEVFTSTTQQLWDMGIASGDLAKRLMQKKCLWLLRMADKDLHRIHEAELWGKYGFEGQGLDIVELAALYAHMPKKLSNDGPGKRKEAWLKRLESTVRSFMAEEKAGRLAAAKLRHPAYKGAIPPFSERSTLFERTSTVVGDAFGEKKRDSWKDLGRGDGQRVKSVAELIAASSSSSSSSSWKGKKSDAAVGSSLDVSAVSAVKKKLGALLLSRDRSSSRFSDSAREKEQKQHNSELSVITTKDYTSRPSVLPSVLNPLVASAAGSGSGSGSGSRVISTGSKTARLSPAFTPSAPPPSQHLTGPSKGAGASEMMMEERRKTLLAALSKRKQREEEDSSRNL
jgi:hypothetical protein